MNSGWQCPRCGRCYAPWMAECPACNPDNQMSKPYGLTANLKCKSPVPPMLEGGPWRRCGACEPCMLIQLRERDTELADLRAELAEEKESHLETAAIMRRIRDRRDRMKKALEEIESYTSGHKRSCSCIQCSIWDIALAAIDAKEASDEA